MEEKDGTGLHDLAIDLDADAYNSQLEAFTDEDNRIFNELWTELNKNTGIRLAKERTRLASGAARRTAEIMVRFCVSVRGNTRLTNQIRSQCDFGT